MRKSHRTSRAVFLFFVVVMPDQCRQLLAILRMKMYGHKPYYHRSGSSGRLSEQDLKYFEMLEDMNVESVTFDPSLKKFRESGEDKEGSLEEEASQAKL